MTPARVMTSGSLDHEEGAPVIDGSVPPDCDVCLALAWARTRIAESSVGIRERRTEAELVEDLARDEERMGRKRSRSEVVSFTVGYFAPSYTGTAPPLWTELAWKS